MGQGVQHPLQGSQAGQAVAEGLADGLAARGDHALVKDHQEAEGAVVALQGQVIVLSHVFGHPLVQLPLDGVLWPAAVHRIEGGDALLEQTIALGIHGGALLVAHHDLPHPVRGQILQVDESVGIHQVQQV